VELLDDANGSLTWEFLYFSSLFQDTEEAGPLLTLFSSGCGSMPTNILVGFYSTHWS